VRSPIKLRPFDPQVEHSEGSRTKGQVNGLTLRRFRLEWPAAMAEKTEEKKQKAAPAAAAESTGETCRAEKCKQAVRAKGYCRKHYMAWRRGDVGDHHRYKICSKEGCRKPRTKGGLCDEHAGIAPAAGAEGGAAA